MSADINIPLPQVKPRFGVAEMQQIDLVARRARRRRKPFPYPSWGRHHVRTGSKLYIQQREHWHRQLHLLARVNALQQARAESGGAAT